MDAVTYLAAGERLNAGHPLYKLSEGDRPVYLLPPVWTTPLVSPPLIAGLWRPLAALPSAGGAFIWWVASTWAISVALLMLWRREPVVTALAMIIFSIPIAQAIAAANVNSFLLLGAVMVWRWFLTSHEPAAGLGAGAMAAVKLTPLILAWWLLAVGRVRSFAWAVTGIGVAMILSLILAGWQAHIDYIAMITSPGSLGVYPDSLAAGAIDLGLPGTYARSISWVVAGVGGIIVVLLRHSPGWSFVVAILTMYYGSPATTSSWTMLLLAALAPLAYPSRVREYAGSGWWSWLGPLQRVGVETERTSSRVSRSPHWRIALAAVLWLAIAGAVLLAFIWPVVSPNHMLIIAHRGIVSEWPEDSLQAVQAVVSTEADGVEFDVNRSSDGTWWLVHDDLLDDKTTGSGTPWQHDDAELALMTYDGGMGYNPSRHAGLVHLARLADVLEVLADYRGLVIVDCKDARPGAHADLARLLLRTTTIKTVIARTIEGAQEFKSVDSGFRVIMVPDEVLRTEVDVWIGKAGDLWPGHSTFADLVGDFGMYVSEDHWPQDEWPLLDDGRRHGVSFVISNDVARALAWRATVEGTASAP